MESLTSDTGYVSSEMGDMCRGALLESGEVQEVAASLPITNTVKRETDPGETKFLRVVDIREFLLMEFPGKTNFDLPETQRTLFQEYRSITNAIS